MTFYKAPDWRTDRIKSRDAFPASLMASISCPMRIHEVTINGQTITFPVPAIYGIRGA